MKKIQVSHLLYCITLVKTAFSLFYFSSGEVARLTWFVQTEGPEERNLAAQHKKGLMTKLFLGKETFCLS